MLMTSSLGPQRSLYVNQKEDGIFICQDKYVADILKKFNFATVKIASTLIETNKALLKDEEAEDVDVHLYRSMIGSLMYLTASRPDIMFAVCACARDSPFDLEAFSDSDYAGASLDRKSTTGGCQFLGKRCCGSKIKCLIIDGISDEFGVKTGSCKVNAVRQDLVLLGESQAHDLETLWKLVKAKHGNTRPEDEYERVLWGDMKIQKMNIKFRGGLLGLKDFKMILRVTTAQLYISAVKHNLAAGLADRDEIKDRLENKNTYEDKY
ncbi:hypothetical protein Tco_0373793 [Tanacetum coccineum]